MNDFFSHQSRNNLFLFDPIWLAYQNNIWHSVIFNGQNLLSSSHFFLAIIPRRIKPDFLHTLILTIGSVNWILNANQLLCLWEISRISSSTFSIAKAWESYFTTLLTVVSIILILDRRLIFICSLADFDVWKLPWTSVILLFQALPLHFHLILVLVT